MPSLTQTQAGGNSGRFIAEALLKKGKHTVTAISRAQSTSKLPEGVNVKKVDYSKPETLVDALRGQDALVVTLSGFTPQETVDTIVNAAGDGDGAAKRRPKSDGAMQGR